MGDWIAQLRRERLIGASSFNLDFHSISYFGADPVVEKHYVPRRSQRRQAVLAFLEANKQLYPDSYARALKMCEAYNCYGTDAAHLQHAYSMIELASAMDGILKGIAAVEGADNAPRSD